MNREDLEASWRRTRAHLAAGAGFRCPWDIGTVYEGRPTLNDAAVVLLHTAELAPGDTAVVRLHPLAPEFWGRHLVRRTIRPWDGKFFGEAVISSAVAPWSKGIHDGAGPSPGLQQT